MPYLLKLALTVVMVLAITEATKRFGFWGSLLAALPVVSLISMVWIYLDTRDVQRISDFSIQVFWFVLPSLGLFLALPWLLARFSFFASLGLGCLITAVLYLLMLGAFRILRFDPF
ncbi:MAG: DUF3147 family protein [Chthoniobacterales bacterium]|nr:DUF3147 family protein [Chthoniobacterales bacterium]